MTTNTSGGTGANWSGILIALIGAISTLAATWLTIQHSAAAAPAPVVQTQAIAPVPGAASPAAQALVIIPDVRGVPLQQAQQQLSALGLAVVVANTPDQQPADTVLNSIPEPGQTVSAGSSVVVQVSAGPSTSEEGSDDSDGKAGKGKKDD